MYILLGMEFQGSEVSGFTPVTLYDNVPRGNDFGCNQKVTKGVSWKSPGLLVNITVLIQ